MRNTPANLAFSTRENRAVEFCAEQEIPLYAVNENPGNHYAASIGLKPTDNRKVYADLYIDDKVLNPAQIETALMLPFPSVPEPDTLLKLGYVCVERTSRTGPGNTT